MFDAARFLIGLVIAYGCGALLVAWAERAGWDPVNVETLAQFLALPLLWLAWTIASAIEDWRDRRRRSPDSSSR